MSIEADRNAQRTGRRVGTSLNRVEVADTLRVLRAWLRQNPGRPLPLGAARFMGKLVRMHARMEERSKGLVT